jgi:hypothetical protein
MSALLPIADIDQHDRDVRFVPKADISQFHSITASARCRNGSGIVNDRALIDNNVELGGLFDRKFGRLRAA